MDEAAFRECVYDLVAAIPPGRVMTYGQISRALGFGRSARRVGRALGRLPGDRPIPWHRVVNHAGAISERWPRARMDHQRALLVEEGVVFNAKDRIDLRRYAWEPDLASDSDRTARSDPACAD